MKKQLIALASLALVSTPALATKARMIALGENINDNIGSLYFSDSRNVFQNAAYANDYKNMVIAEWGANGASSTVAGKGDSDKTPQAEGGFLKSAGNYVYGLYVGAESPYTNELRGYSRSLRNDAFHQDNQIDLFFAGEGSVKWGTNLTYSNSKRDSEKAKQQSLSVRFGVIADKIEGFANVSLANKAEVQSLAGANPTTGAPNGGKDKFEGKLGFELGGTYNADFAKLFAYVRHAEWEHDADSVNSTTAPYTAYTGKFDGSYWLYQVGAGKEHKLNDKATLFTKLEYLNFMRKVEPTSGAANGAEINLDDYYVPVTVGLEYDAASWLTVRGSVVQNLVSQTDNDYDGKEANVSSGVLLKRSSGKRTIANSTNVNAGLTLKFGELSVDGVIGTDGTANDSKSEKGNLTLDSLASRVSMTYRF
jgi:hypothetical protein